MQRGPNPRRSDFSNHMKMCFAPVRYMYLHTCKEAIQLDKESCSNIESLSVLTYIYTGSSLNSPLLKQVSTSDLQISVDIIIYHVQ